MLPEGDDGSRGGKRLDRNFMTRDNSPNIDIANSKYSQRSLPQRFALPKLSSPLPDTCSLSHCFFVSLVARGGARRWKSRSITSRDLIDFLRSTNPRSPLLSNRGALVSTYPTPRKLNPRRRSER